MGGKSLRQDQRSDEGIVATMLTVCRILTHADMDCTGGTLRPVHCISTYASNCLLDEPLLSQTERDSATLPMLTMQNWSTRYR